LAQSIFAIEDTIPHNTILCTDNVNHKNGLFITSYSRYPDITPVVAGDECSLASKVVSILAVNYPTEIYNSIMGKLVLYALLRLFLGFLMYGKFDVNILLQKYTTKFFNDA